MTKTESEFTRPLLSYLSTFPEKFFSKSEYERYLREHFKDDIKGSSDQDGLNNRNDDKFSQKVRNIVSHRDTSTNPICRGLIEYKPRVGLKITKKGLKYIGK